MPTVAEKRAAFRKLHEADFFVLPNPWDVGSALHLQRMGFKALASTSSGFANTLGRPDYGVTRDELLAHLAAVSAAIEVPFNADFEGGYAVEPDGVAANVRLAIETGVAGLSIEDRAIGAEPGLLDLDLAVERIKAARAEIDRDASGVVLVGRCEGYLVGQADLKKTIERLEAYADAGADCLYPPGPRDAGDIAAIVKALAPKPVNILLRGPTGPSPAQLRDLGVRRVSTGGALAFVAQRAFDEAAKQLLA
jgi:2-methylisocitrate lyase-like PEP mutase family enzyme